MRRRCFEASLNYPHVFAPSSRDAGRFAHPGRHARRIELPGIERQSACADPKTWNRRIRDPVGTYPGQFRALLANCRGGRPDRRLRPDLLDETGNRSARAFLHWAYLAKSHRRKGAGRQLLDELLVWARANGANRVELRYIDGNETAQRFWAKMGFQPFAAERTVLAWWMRPDGGRMGTAPFTPAPTDATAIPWRLEL